MDAPLPPAPLFATPFPQERPEHRACRDRTPGEHASLMIIQLRRGYDYCICLGTHLDD